MFARPQPVAHLAKPAGGSVLVVARGPVVMPVSLWVLSSGASWRDDQAGLEPVFVEAVTRPRAAEPGVVLVCSAGTCCCAAMAPRSNTGGRIRTTNDLARLMLRTGLSDTTTWLRKRQGCAG